jgi:ligand-binding sensor domain-containing protein/predicted Ser/Thr protein kinase
MATVFKAYQASMDRYVAVKILPSHFTQDETFMGRFTQEARTLARLEHPHILPVHDYGEQEGTTFLVMRYVEGGTLKEVITRHGPMELKEVLRVLSQVGRALDYAHSQGVVHRDIKPTNILVDQEGNTFLTDFGIAKLVAETAQLTASGAIIGTPAYMSPEQGMGQPVDHRCDVYSLGVVLYELITGRVPFEAETPLAVLLKHINDPLPLPRQIRPDLPEAVERVILKAMAKVPNDRFQSAQEMIDALAEAVTSRPAEVVSPPPSAEAAEGATVTWDVSEPPPPADTSPPPAPEAAPPARRRIRWLLPVGAVVLVGLFLVIRLLIPSGPTGDGPTPTVEDQAEATPAVGGEVQHQANWTNYGNGNFVFTLALQEDTLWAGGEHGLVHWDLTDGSYVQIGKAEGLASNRIFDLLLDDTGVLWIATDAGINRYDGETMITYDEGDGLDASWIQSLFQDEEGGLWAGSRGGERGLNYYDGESWGPPPITALPVEFPNVQALEANGTDGLLVGLDDQGLALFDGAEWTLLTGADGLPSDQVLDALAAEDALWVSTDLAVVRFDLETGAREIISQTNVHAIHQAADGAFWLGGESRASRFDPDTGNWQEFEATPGPIPGTMVTDIVHDESGLWFGTYGGGVAFYDGSRWEIWAIDAELGGNWIEAIMQDGDGAIWFSHPGSGLSRYQPEQDTWQVFGEAEGALDWPAIPAVDSAGNLWIGEYGELIYYDGRGWQRFTSPELADIEVYAIHFGPDDVKWLVGDGAIVRHNPATDEWTTFTSDDHPIIEDIRAVLAASDGTVWLGGDEGLARYDGDVWSTPEASGSAPQYVDDLAEAPDGSIWVAADGELVHLTDDQWSYVSWPSDGWLNEVTVGPEGGVWAGHEGMGHYDPASGEWQMFMPSDGLVHLIVHAIHVTSEGVVWVGTEGGVSRYAPSGQ